MQRFQFRRPCGFRAALLVTFLFAFSATEIPAQIDNNGNGLSDVWELMHGNALSPDGDPDNDGFSNMQEGGAGTDPFNANSQAALSIDIVNDQIRATWEGVIGKTYELQLCDDLLGGSWQSHGIQLQAAANGSMEINLGEEVPLLLLGGIRHLVWENTQGIWYNGVPDLIANSVPDSDILATAMEIPPNTRDYFVDRMIGYVVPERTGPHRFYVCGDDVTELFLSPSANPDQMTSIAEVPGWTGYNQFDKYPEQTSPWIELNANQPYYIELRHIEGSGGDHFRVFWQQPGEDTGSLLSGEHLAPFQTNQEIINLAETHFFRNRITNQDTDGDGATDWEETVLGLPPAAPNTPAEISAAMLGDDALVSLEVLTAEAYESFQGAPRQAARLRLKRSGSNFPLDVNLGLSGDSSFSDFANFPASVRFETGEREVAIDLLPANDNATESRESATITILPGARYLPGGVPAATITVEDGPPALYLADLRPEGAAVTSASGYSILRLAANRTYWHVDLEFDGLTSPQVTSHVHYGPPGQPGPIVHGIPGGDFTDFDWTLTSAGNLSVNDLLTALPAGNLYINVHSVNYPNGEIRGQYRPVTGAQTIEPPAPPPGWNANDTADLVAARFLNQATFGVKAGDIPTVQSLGYEGWINQQMALPVTTHRAYMSWIESQFPLTTQYNENYADTDTELEQRHRREAFWHRAVFADDQLRQRVAFALSQIFVISDKNDYVYNAPLGSAVYYDILLGHAFGNYRDLLEDVSLNPLMGNYLSSFRNPKPDPILGIRPDENYAREVMQLFSIGLWNLHPDGSLRLDDRGRPIPTYDQADITAMAHVFTGWAYYSTQPDPNFWYGPHAKTVPMMQYPDFHDTGEKRILNGVVLPAAQTGEQDLEVALDTLFNHPNTGPFICRQLIQRLVTANPSRAYLYRVASVFADNGQGVRGDLGAVVKAILLDYEARHPTPAAATNFGHLKEPVLRLAHILRTFNFTSPLPDNRITLHWLDNNISQPPLGAGSVFNFFEPAYSPPGLLSEQGLTGPEFQITDETRVIETANFLFPILHGFGPYWGGDYRGRIDIVPEVALLENQGIDALFDHLNLTLCHGQLTPQLRSHIADLDTILIPVRNPTYRTQNIIQMIVNAPDYAIQK